MNGKHFFREFIEMTTASWEEDLADGISGVSVEQVSASEAAIRIQNEEILSSALLNVANLDALVRALSAVRIAISREPPR